LDHQLNIRKVKPSGGYIGGNDHFDLSALEISVYLFAIWLRHISMKHCAAILELTV
jgi:hypothetical protein